MVLTGETHQMSSVHIAPEEFHNARSRMTGHFGYDLCLRKTLSEKSHTCNYRDHIVFEKPPFSECFPSTEKRKAAVFKIPPV